MFNQNAALGQGTNIPSFNGEFLQYAADNVDHNTTYLSNTPTNLCKALLNFLLFCFILYCYASVQYCYVK